RVLRAAVALSRGPDPSRLRTPVRSRPAVPDGFGGWCLRRVGAPIGRLACSAPSRACHDRGVLTLLLYGLLAVLVIGILFVAAVYFLPRGEQLAIPAPDSHTWALLPRGHIQPDDVTALRLPVALRGYRFAETDLLLDRLTDELRARDEEIER